MNIYEAITSIMQKGYAVGKDRKNEQQRFLYRGIDDVMNVFQPLMAEAGIFMVPEVLETIREDRQTSKGGNLIYSMLKVKYSFFASDGSHVDAVVVGEGMDSGDKASNKAMAAAMKYALFQTFCIPTEELSDPDAFSPPPSQPAERRDSLHFRCEQCGKVLVPVPGKDGKTIGVREQAELSRRRFGGKTLCPDCMKSSLGGGQKKESGEKGTGKDAE